MKKVFTLKAFSLLLMAFAIFAMTSCTKTDDRDQFVGDYTLKVTGNLAITINGQTVSENFDQTSSISITKAAGETSVNVSGFYECLATVSGNTISMDPMTDTQTQEGITMQMTLTPRRGTLNGDVLTFVADVTGSAYYNGDSYPISGTLYNEAVKQ